MSDELSIGDAFKALRQQRSENKRARREHGAAVLRKAGIYCDVHNGGAHLVVHHEDRTVDYWPGTGRYIERGGQNASGRGLSRLMRALGVRR